MSRPPASLKVNHSLARRAAQTRSINHNVIKSLCWGTMIALGDTIPPQLGAEKPESLLPCHARCNPRCNSAQNTPTDDHHGLGGGGGEV